MSSLKSRLLVSVVGVPLLLWVVLGAPSVVMLIALGVLAAIGGAELQKCVGSTERKDMELISAVCAAVTVCWCAWQPERLAALFAATAIIIFGFAIVKGGEIKFGQIMAALFGSIAIGYGFAAFLRLESAGLHRAYLLLPFILSFACDTFAYFVGCTIGKHKLAPKVSPKKSVEGSIGGLAGNVLCGLLFAFVMNRWFNDTIAYGTMLVLALVCGVVAQIGDLSFSLIKREFGVKDYGKLFLAHGGVLDRFDSVLFVAPVIEIVLNLMK